MSTVSNQNAAALCVPASGTNMEEPEQHLEALVQQLAHLDTLEAGVDVLCAQLANLEVALCV